MKFAKGLRTAGLAAAVLADSGAALSESASQHLRHRQEPQVAQLAADGEGGLATRMVQKEVEQMAARAERLAGADASAAAEVEGALEDIEAALAPKAVADPALEGEILVVRAELCAKHGFESRERKDCEVYMQSACFHKRKHEAEAPAPKKQEPEDQEDDTEDAPALLQVGKEPEAPAAGDLAKPKTEAKVSALVCKRFFREVAATEGRFEVGALGVAGGAPAPAAPAALSPSPAVPASGSPAWFGADPEDGLPENGVDGPLVDHDDQVTQTSDWQEEFGPKAGQRSYKEICKEFPDNEWCQLHMHWQRRKEFPKLSAATRPGSSALLVAAAAAAIAACGLALQ